MIEPHPRRQVYSCPFQPLVGPIFQICVGLKGPRACLCSRSCGGAGHEKLERNLGVRVGDVDVFHSAGF